MRLKMYNMTPTILQKLLRKFAKNINLEDFLIEN